MGNSHRLYAASRCGLAYMAVSPFLLVFSFFPFVLSPLLTIKAQQLPTTMAVKGTHHE
jgi:hypothetical protein